MTFPRNDHVFAVSEDVRRTIRYPRWLPAMRMPPVETLHHGIDLRSVAGWVDRLGARTEFGIPPDTPVVGTVANFRTIKGHRYLVRAASTVLESVPDARFVLVGSGPLEEAVKAQAAAAGLGDRMVFAGFRADAPRLMSMFDVFVLPSTHEGLPISLVEAMALGVAPIVTKVGGNVEVIEHGRQGLLVPPMAPEALARAIVSVLRDAPLRRRLGFGARERARRFDVRHSVWRTEQIYRKLAS
jgi:glycosyltransferase involved in cell wall biosynthesis